MAEFADVSVPRMAQQPRPAGGADWLRRNAVTLAELRQQMLRECQDVVSTIAQRRNFQSEQTEPVMEVVAKFTGLHRLAKVAVAGGDDADVDVDLPVAAQSPDAPVLDRLEHLGLQAKR